MGVGPQLRLYLEEVFELHGRSARQAAHWTLSRFCRTVGAEDAEKRFLVLCLLDSTDAIVGWVMDSTYYAFWKARRVFPGHAEPLVAEYARHLEQRGLKLNAITLEGLNESACAWALELMEKSDALDPSARYVLWAPRSISVTGVLLQAVGLLLLLQDPERWGAGIAVTGFCLSIVSALAMAFRDRFFFWLIGCLVRAAAARLPEKP